MTANRVFYVVEEYGKVEFKFNIHVCLLAALGVRESWMEALQQDSFL